MTLREVMQADVSAVFLITTDHAETIRYRQNDTGLWVSVTAIVERNEGVQVTGYDDGRGCELQATIYCQTTSPLDDVKEGSQFEFDSHEWRVEGRPQNDGFGMQSLMVVRQRTMERSAREYRLNR